MKIILSILFIFLFVSFSRAQEINKETFVREVRTIMEDAKSGFPKTRGEYKSEIYYFGHSYFSNTSLFGPLSDAVMIYRKPLESKYTKPVSEQFYFAQSFKDSSAAGKFAIQNAEDILDDIAKEAGLKKVNLKQEKENRNKFRETEYRAYGKEVLGIKWYLDDNTMSVQIYSPYRPQDVKVANLLGCMVFSFPNMGFLYAVPVYGAALGDKEKVAAAAYAKSGLVERNYQYEWMPGMSPVKVEQKFEKQTRVTVLNSYTVE